MRPFVQTVLVLMSLCVGVQAAGASELGIEVTFDDAEIETIRAYYRDHGSNDGHGNKHGKAKGLPPGIAKNMQRGKPLPPGIAKQNLPNDLILELPPLPSGYERIIVVGKILIVEISTQIIHDVLSDILLD